MINWPEIVIDSYLFVVGACIGSFLNVLIYRIPRCLNIAKGRSFCPACGHTLAARDLVPLLSWALLRRRCRYCGARIGRRYPLVELTGGLLAVEGVLVFGYTGMALVSFAAGCILVTISLIDADTQEIPDSLNIALLAVALFSLLAGGAPLPERLIGAACVSVPMLLINVLRRTSFGGGDIKLAAAAGLLLGWRLMLVAGFLSLLGGGGYGIWLLASRRKTGKDHFAFGPFLGAGVYVSLLFGSELLAAYLDFFNI